MCFEGTLHRIIQRVLVADPRLCLVCLGKVDLADAYMRLRFRLEDTPSVAFLVLRKTPTYKQLVGFHILLPMGYVDSAPYFCVSTETITDMANSSMDGRHMAPPHPLEGLDEAPALAERAPEQADDKQWTRTPPEHQVHALYQIDGRPGKFYLDLPRRPQGKVPDAPPTF